MHHEIPQRLFVSTGERLREQVGTPELHKYYLILVCSSRASTCKFPISYLSLLDEALGKALNRDVRSRETTVRFTSDSGGGEGARKSMFLRTHLNQTPCLQYRPDHCQQDSE